MIHKNSDKKKLLKNTNAKYSIKDVARESNVSVATVSNVISEKKYVSPELTKRVNDVINKMNYKPSKVARSLKGRKTYLIGLMIPDIINPYFAEIARGAESIALEKGYQVLLCNTDGIVEREEKILIAFEEDRVDGIINVAPRMDEEKLLDYDSVPMVLIDRPLKINNSRYGNVHSDNNMGGMQLAEHLLEKGHKRFACLMVPFENIPSIENRINGFEKFLVENGILNENIIKVEGKLTYESGFELMNEILSMDQRPTAIFACSDIMAWGALEAVKKEKLNIPKDIAIAGFDNIYFSKILEPQLTTVNQMKYKSGVIAMKMLLDFNSIEQMGIPIINNTIILETELIVRETT
jgi:LacI family transcriptional regulator